MSDIICRLCGEPWDAYGAKNSDMRPDEYARFILGKGCPSCDFGNAVKPDDEPETAEFLRSLDEATDDDEVEQAILGIEQEENE